MGLIYDGDGELHWCDGSHRWLAPPGMDQEAWEAGVRAHVDEHRRTMGGPPCTTRPQETPQSFPVQRAGGWRTGRRPRRR